MLRFHLVPNVPCGVESLVAGLLMDFLSSVPNVPCGVESLLALVSPVAVSPVFLMYRVELKAV